MSTAAGDTAGTDQTPTDQEIINYEREIKQKVMLEPIISPLIGFDDLVKEYSGENAHIFSSKIAHLTTLFSGMRKTRRDGNCFYRALAFRFAVLLSDTSNPEWAKWALQNAKNTKDLLVRSGYQLAAIEDFYDMFIETISKPTIQELTETLQTEYISDTVVCYLKLVAAAFLKENRETFEAFVLDLYPTLDEFISYQVEPMHVEADNPQIVALCNALGVGFKIYNLDSSKTDDGKANFFEFSPMDPPAGIARLPQIALLFRPGHYDLLSKYQ